MRRLSLILAVTLACSFALADSTALVRAFPFGDSGHLLPLYQPTFQDDLSGSCSGGSYTSTSGHTLTCNNTTTDAVDVAGYTQGVLDGKARWFDGSNDSLSVADGSGGEGFEFTEDFTVIACITPQIVTGTKAIIGKWNTDSDQRTWLLQTNDAGVELLLSADGAAVTTANKASVLAIGKKSCIVASYDKSAAEVNIWVDEATVDTTGSMSASLFDSTSPAAIGMQGDLTTGAYLGTMDHASAVPFEYSDSDAHRTLRHFRGLTDQAGIHTVSVTSASPPMAMVAAPDSGVEPFLVPQPANSTTIGPHGLYGASGVTNLVHRGTLETWAAGAPTGWSKLGSGTYDVAQETTKMTDGLSSARLTTGHAGGDYVEFRSACIDVSTGVGEDIYASHWGQGDAAADDVFVRIHQWSADDCTTYLGYDVALSSFDPGTSWEQRVGSVASADFNAATESIRVGIYLSTQDATYYVDSIYLGTSDPSVRDSYCGADTDAAVTCSAVIESKSHTLTAGTWTWDATVRSHVDGAEASPTRWIMRVPPTAGDANAIEVYWASDVLTFNVYTSGEVQKTATVAAAGDADTSYSVRVKHTADGRIVACWDGTCGAEATDALIETPSTTMYLGNNGSSAGEVHVIDVKSYRRWIQ